SSSSDVRYSSSSSIVRSGSSGGTVRKSATQLRPNALSTSAAHTGSAATAAWNAALCVCFHGRHHGSTGTRSSFSADTVSVSCDVPNRAFTSVSASTRNSDNVSPPPEPVGDPGPPVDAAGHGHLPG